MLFPHLPLWYNFTQSHPVVATRDTDLITPSLSNPNSDSGSTIFLISLGFFYMRVSFGTMCQACFRGVVAKGYHTSYKRPSPSGHASMRGTCFSATVLIIWSHQYVPACVYTWPFGNSRLLEEGVLAYRDHFVILALTLNWRSKHLHVVYAHSLRRSPDLELVTLHACGEPVERTQDAVGQIRRKCLVRFK